jgi:calcineurin-like phosphoesterase family protein
VEEMNNSIIRKWNERVKPFDTVIHLGDFCFRNSLGGKEGEGGLNNAQSWRAKLNGSIVFVKGNHDRNNSLKTPITHLLLDMGGRIILCQHHPIEHPKEIPDMVDLVLCGHVHEKWFGRNYEGIPVINVGVDRNDFYPWKINELFYWADRIEKGEEI